MRKVGKKHLVAKETIAKIQINSWQDAVQAVVKTAHSKFDETASAAIILGIDASKGEQTVRGSALLPHGTGKKIRVIVFAKGEHEEKAKRAGADFVGLEDLVEKIIGGWMDFDAAVATPDVMGIVGKAAKVLGPRGLLPNKKDGTVTFDVAEIISDLKKGRVSFRNDKSGVVHAPFGKLSFGAEKLTENLTNLVKSVVAAKPATAKGKYLKKIIIASTMGAGVSLNLEQQI